MFTTEETKNIDNNYFRIIQISSYSVTLQSLNSKHYWYILHEVGTRFNYSTCQIYHKHREQYPWHRHSNKPTLMDSIDMIIDHDNYWMKKKKI